MGARLNRRKDGLYLYRNIFPTQVRDLCFIGSETSTFNNILTQGLQSLWLRRVLSGTVALPSVEAMNAVIAVERKWKRSWMPKKGDRAAILPLHKMKYHDQLCKDMGVNHMRKGWNVLAEVFSPYSAADYAGLFADARECISSRIVIITSLIVAAVGFLGTGSVRIAGGTGLMSMAAPTLIDTIVFMMQAFMEFADTQLSALKSIPLL